MQPRRDPEPRPPKEPDLTPRQRWVAAQRLAAGDRPRLVAAMVGARLASLQLLLAEDPEFAGLVEDCRAIHALPRDEWRARAELFARDAAERAMVDGRVSTLNLVLKATDLLHAGTSGDDDYEGSAEAALDRLTDEQFAEYEALGDPEDDGEEGGDGNNDQTGRRAKEALPPYGQGRDRRAPDIHLVPQTPELPSLDAAPATAVGVRQPEAPRARASVPPVSGGPLPTLLATTAMPSVECGLRLPCPGPAEAEAAMLNATRLSPSNASQPQVRPQLRRAREPVPAWHRRPGGWPRAP